MWEEKATGMLAWTLQKQSQQRAVCNFEDMSEPGQGEATKGVDAA